GEILGFLGPNGAGKSTTVKMLTGLIEPSQGQILYEGRSVYDDFTAFQRRIGYVPEEAHLYPHLSGWEYLQLVGRLRGIERRVLEPKMDEFLRLFTLWDDRFDPLSSYSKGMRQKILLSAALLHNPDILILDEPFSGLDATTAMVLRSLIQELAREGKIILYSSHVLEVVEKVCSQVVILRKGEVAAYDSIDNLRDLMRQPSLEGVFAQLAETEDSDAVADKILKVMNDDGSAGAMPQEASNVPSEEMPRAADYLGEVRKDLRYALRMLARSPGFTVVALISLALGACFATCALSEMNGMVWRDVPLVAKPNELVSLQAQISYPDYKRYREQTDLFTNTMAYVAPVPFSIGRTERVWGQLVTPSYFDALGIHPAQGSFFDARYDRPEAPAVVVSYRFWQQHLGSDSSAIGRPMRIDGQTATVLGVAPSGFLGASPVLYPADLWMPLSAGARIAPELAGDTLERRDRQIFRVTGRLRPGVNMARAEAALDTVARKIEEDSGDPDRHRPGRRVTLLDGGKQLQFRKQDKPVFTSFFLLIAGLMMLVPCTNIANMMLARA
ncbi:MAG TPA: ATP-binding cassette domain-containing protein, partial [Candidatus Binataceae bacterium]